MTEATQPRPSSTVVLVRDGADAPEFFMVKRPAAASFGDVFVFPGGTVDPDDYEVAERCAGITEEAARKLMALDDMSLCLYSAAIRELFEETGVLLAEHSLSAGALADAREALNDGATRWRDFLAETNARLRCDALHYFSHWITPAAFAKRFSTRFFLARLPDGQTATHCERELTASRWVAAKTALDEDAVPLHFPTQKNVELLAKHDSVDALLAWADARAAEGIAAICPQVPSAPAPANLNLGSA